jgi:hypothetical protein
MFDCETMNDLTMCEMLKYETNWNYLQYFWMKEIIERNRIVILKLNESESKCKFIVCVIICYFYVINIVTYLFIYYYF